MIQRHPSPPLGPAPQFHYNQLTFEQVVESYQSRIYCLCDHLLGDVAEAEDATQETLLRAHLHRYQFDPARSLSAWLMSIAAHYCIDRLRRRHLHCIGLDDERYAGHPALREAVLDPEAIVVTIERWDALHCQVWQLRPRDREVIVLRYWGHRSHAEIAAAIGCTPSAVKSRLHAARLRLKALLDPPPSSRLVADKRVIASLPIVARRSI
jgi:RNA polymerase sigma-70 factor (ECF subfamily)